jgi:hypothetical protein
MSVETERGLSLPHIHFLPAQTLAELRSRVGAIAPYEAAPCGWNVSEALAVLAEVDRLRGGEQKNPVAQLGLGEIPAPVLSRLARECRMAVEEYDRRPKGGMMVGMPAVAIELPLQYARVLADVTRPPAPTPEPT